MVYTSVYLFKYFSYVVPTYIKYLYYLTCPDLGRNMDVIHRFKNSNTVPIPRKVLSCAIQMYDCSPVSELRNEISSNWFASN